MEQFTGKVWVLGDDIDTDIIIPTEYLALPSVEDMKQYGFSPLRPELAGQIDRLFGWGRVCQAVQTGCLSFDNREPSPFGRGGGRKMWRNPWNQAAAGLSLRGGSYIII